MSIIALLFSASAESRSTCKAQRSPCKDLHWLHFALAETFNDVSGWYEAARSSPWKSLHLRMCFSAVTTEQRGQQVLQQHSSFRTVTVQKCKEQANIKGLYFSCQIKKMYVKYLGIWGRTNIENQFKLLMVYFLLNLVVKIVFICYVKESIIFSKAPPRICHWWCSNVPSAYTNREVSWDL